MARQVFIELEANGNGAAAIAQLAATFNQQFDLIEARAKKFAIDLQNTLNGLGKGLPTGTPSAPRGSTGGGSTGTGTDTQVLREKELQATLQRGFALYEQNRQKVAQAAAALRAMGGDTAYVQAQIRTLEKVVDSANGRLLTIKERLEAGGKATQSMAVSANIAVNRFNQLDGAIAQTTARVQAQIAVVKNSATGWGRFEQSISSVSKTLIGVGVGLSGIGAIAIRAGQSFLQSSGEVEASKLALQSFGLSTKEVAAQYARLLELAKRPALDPKPLLQYSLQLQQLGIGFEDATRLQAAFGNAIARTGGGAEAYAETIEQVLQSLRSGKILLGDFRTLFRTLGDLSPSLQNAFGTADLEALRERGLGSKEVIAGIVKEFEKLPLVAGGTKNALENLGIAFEQFKARLGDALAPVVIPFLNQLTNSLTLIADKVASIFTALPASVQIGIVALTGLSIPLGALLITIGLLGTQVVGLATFFTSFGAGAAAAAAGSTLFSAALVGFRTALQSVIATSLAFLATPLGIALAALALVVTVATVAWLSYESATNRALAVSEKTVPDLVAQRKILQDTAVSLSDTSASAKQLENGIKLLSDAEKAHIDSLKTQAEKIEETRQALIRKKETTDELLQANRLIIAQGLGEAAVSLDNEKAKLEKLRLEFESATKNVEQYTKAQEESARALGVSTVGMETAQERIQRLSNEYTKQKIATDTAAAGERQLAISLISTFGSAEKARTGIEALSRSNVIGKNEAYSATVALSRFKDEATNVGLASLNSAKQVETLAGAIQRAGIAGGRARLTQQIESVVRETNGNLQETLKKIKESNFGEELKTVKNLEGVLKSASIAVGLEDAPRATRTGGGGGRAKSVKSSSAKTSQLTEAEQGRIEAIQAQREILEIEYNRDVFNLERANKKKEISEKEYTATLVALYQKRLAELSTFADREETIIRGSKGLFVKDRIDKLAKISQDRLKAIEAARKAEIEANDKLDELQESQREAHLKRLQKLDEDFDKREIRAIKEQADRLEVTYEQADRKIFEIEATRLQRRRNGLINQLGETSPNDPAKQEKITTELDAVGQQLEQLGNEQLARQTENRRKDIEGREKYNELLRKSNLEAIQIELDSLVAQRQAGIQNVEDRRANAQKIADIQDTIARKESDIAQARIKFETDALLIEANARKVGQEEIERIQREGNSRIINEQNRLKSELEIISNDALSATSEGTFIGGILAAANALGQGGIMEAAINNVRRLGLEAGKLSVSMQGFKNVAAGALGAVSNKLGEIVGNFILTGKTGANVLGQLTKAGFQYLSNLLKQKALENLVHAGNEFALGIAAAANPFTAYQAPIYFAAAKAHLVNAALAGAGAVGLSAIGSAIGGGSSQAGSQAGSVAANDKRIDQQTEYLRILAERQQKIEVALNIRSEEGILVEKSIKAFNQNGGFTNLLANAGDPLGSYGG